MSQSLPELGPKKVDLKKLKKLAKSIRGDTPNKLQIILADFGGKVLQDQATTTHRIKPVEAAIKTLILEMAKDSKDLAELREKIKEF